MATTFKFGNGNWAVKEDLALAYNDENGNFKPLPFDFTRASTATRVNKDGLIETVPSGKPRIDFTDNTSGHLLLEPSRSNLITYSEDFTQWTKQSITDGEISLVSNSLTGSVDASELEDTSTSNYARLTLNTTTSASTAYRFSCFVKKTTGVQTSCPAFQLEVGHDYLVLNTTTGETKTDALDAGNTNYSDINVIDFNSEWWKLEMTATSVGTSTRAAIYPAFTGTFGSSASSSNIGTVTIYGIQVEQGSYATSYIPTEGSTVTRLADDVDTDYGSKNTLSDEVSVYFNLLPQVSTASNTNKCLSFGFNSSSNANSYAVLRFNGTNWSSRIQGTTGNNFNDLGVSQTTEIKAVMVLTQSGYSIYANGSTSVASGSYGGTAPTINSVAFVEILNDTDDRGVYKIKELKVYNTALTEAEAQALTS